FVYRGLDNTLRQTVIEMSPAPTSIEGHTGQWEFELGAGEQKQVEITVIPLMGEKNSKTGFALEFSDCLKTRRERYAKWETDVTHFSSSHGIFDAVLNTAVSD